MSSNTGRLRIFISAAEPSADQHAADLIRRTRELKPEVDFIGVAGPEMIKAGCTRIFDMSRHAAMLLGAVRQAGRAIQMLRACERTLQELAFDGAVVVDSPTLHLPLAKSIHARAIPLMYYIAPQLWAWGRYRIYRLRHQVDEVAVILPFEAEFFRAQGVKATFVGHPSARRFAGLSLDDAEIARIRAAGEPVVGLLPGSREHVCKAILPDQLAIAQQIARRFPHATFPVSVAGDRATAMVEAFRRENCVNVFPVPNRFHELISASDLLLVNSGTAALEVALHHKPMIVMYQASRLFYHLVGRWMIKTPHLSLPNILAGREVVPEFMPYYTSTDPIAAAALDLLQSKEKRLQMSQRLREVVAPLHAKTTTKDAATLLVEMIRARHTTGSRGDTT